MIGGWRVGVDVGGTFTDVVAEHRTRPDRRIAKVPSRTDDRVAGLLAALRAVDLAWSDVDDLVHGTTLVTNAIIEDDLADVALVATRGFSDTLAIGRQNRRHLYRLDLPPKLAPQVPAARRFEVSERVDHEGRVLDPLGPQSVDEAIRRIDESGAEAVAVSLMHSYANPAHEEALGERLRGRFPYVALSNRVNPEAREYERTATTALSAGVMPPGRELPRPARRGEAVGVEAAPVSLGPAAWRRRRRCGSCRWDSPLRDPRPEWPPPAASPGTSASITPSASTWAAPPPTSA